MPRNVSGVYSLPAGYAATANSLATAAQHNDPLEDLQSDANTARPVSAGGTGATTASAARTALGVAIGSDVQAFDATLTSIAALGTAANKFAYTTDVDTWAEAAVTAAGLALLDDADASAQRTTLGLSDALYLDERADHVNTPAAGKGEFWVRNDTPCVPVFTDDAGTDEVLASKAYVDAEISAAGVKAWVNFNGTGTVAIRDSLNVSSITDNGTGDYTINFTTAMASANYAVLLTGVGASLGTTTRSLVVAGTDAGGATLKTTAAVRIQNGVTTASGLIDAAEINAAIFG